MERRTHALGAFCIGDLFHQHFPHADDGRDRQQQVDEFPNPRFRQVGEERVAEQDAEGEAGQEVDVFRQDGGDGHAADGMRDERRDIAEKEKDEAACAQPLGRDFRVCEVEKNRRAAHASRG